MPDAGQKRKRPPTFQHFPPNRAKKLKKAWVEKAKIKSKWKAQKRREGIVPLRSGVQSPEDDDVGTADENDKGSGHSSDSEPVTGAMDFDENSHANSPSDNEVDEIGDNVAAAADTAYLPSPLPPRHLNTPTPALLKKKYNPDNNKGHLLDKNNNRARDGANTNKEQDKQSLRDLFRKAYSKESLHTYKSDPLKKRRSEQRGRGRGRGGSGGNAASTRGRGQPNMKLRMGAMLEKIKRDYS